MGAAELAGRLASGKPLPVPTAILTRGKATGASHMPCKLLIIDDDDDVRESLLAILRGEGFVAEGATSVLAALDLLTSRGFAPDAIVLDLLMPAMSGEQFRRVVQKHAAWTKMPVIACTAD